MKRAHLIAMIGKGYKIPKPIISPLEDNGWEKSEDGIILPVRSLQLPAPQAIVELVKCGCRGQCSINRCSCIKNKLSCTSLCKCNDCSNIQDYSTSFVEEGDLE